MFRKIHNLYIYVYIVVGDCRRISNKNDAFGRFVDRIANEEKMYNIASQTA